MTTHLIRLIICLFFLLNFQFTYAQNAIRERINQNLNQITLTQQRTPLQEVNESLLQIPIQTTALSQRRILQINSTQVQSIINNNSEYLRMSVPVRGQDIELLLHKANIFTNEFRAELSSNPNENLSIDKGLHYWGIVADEPNSLVTISFLGDEIAGGIHYNGEQMSLAKLRNSNYHVLFENKDFDHTLDFNCQALPIDEAQLPSDISRFESASALNCIGIHVEVDRSFYLDQGSSLTNVTNYVNALFGQVAALYANESIQVAISFLRIWDTPDPYNPGNELSDLTNQGYGMSNGNLVHLLHSDGSGGVAYVDALCSSSFNTGVSNIFGTFNNVPTYSWDVEVVTHELGHNFGSPHTHACAWNGNNTAIDGCGPASGNGEGCNGPIPAFGTIMSYCHLVNGSGIDFNLGFGQQPGDLIRSIVANKNCQDFCTIVCPTEVTTAYSQTEDLCAALGTYTLPSSYTGLVLDNGSAATYQWSSGNYISAGGTAINGTTYALTNPPDCAPLIERIYLNVGCSTGGLNDINAGILTLNIYPDPTQFAVTDLVTFTNGSCDAPTWTVTAGCEAYVSVAQNGGPTFPVAFGASGTVDYDVTLTYPLECCSVPGGDIILTGTTGSTTLNTSNDSQACQSGTQPSIWEIPFTIPSAQSATTVNTTGLGSITEVCLDITLNNTDAVILSLDSPDCGAYEWEDLWIGSAFATGGNTGPISVCFTPSASNGSFDGTFDGDGNPNGNGSFSTCGINSNQWVLYIADYNCYLGGSTGGSINSASVSFNDGTEVGQPGLCEFTATATYNCAGCTDCDDPTCTTTQVCDDNDPCTEDDVQTVLSTGDICVPCAGTAIATCSGTTSVQACDDNDPCTENDVQTVDDCDGSICVPCAGTAIASCSGTTSVQACDDNDPCTENDVQTVDDCDGSICVPCVGIAIDSCSGATSVQACDDNDPCTDNDVQTIDDCDGSICVPCAGTAIATCSGTTSVQACDDNDPCTENDVQTVDDCDGSICVPCAGVQTTCSQMITQACDDNNDCTVNDVEIVDVCTGAVCVPCSGASDASSCCADVNLDINFDGFPMQTSWDITDDNGNIMASGGSYNGPGFSSNLNLTPAACLPDGCYTLNFYDSANNGMCPFRSTASSLGTFITPGTVIQPGTIVATLGTVTSPGLCGNYTMTDADGTVLASGGGRFGAQESNTFCLSGGIATLWHEEDNSAYQRQHEENEAENLQVFPTLAKNSLFIYTSEMIQGQINILDIKGQIIQQYEQTTTQMQVNVSDLPAGIYFVQMMANDGILVEKFVKK